MLLGQTVKIVSINEKKGTAKVSFSGTDIRLNLNIVSISLFGELRLRSRYAVHKTTYVLPSTEIGKWMSYKTEDPDVMIVQERSIVYGR